MRRFFLALALLTGMAGPALALPYASRRLTVTVSGNTYNAYALGVTLLPSERYVTLKTRKTGNAATDALVVLDATVAVPNTYTANADYCTIEPGTPMEVWNTGTTGYYFNLTCTGSASVEVLTHKISTP